MRILYQIQITTEGGRADHVCSADGTLDLPLSPPRKLDSAGSAATNPEQLLAAGYTACFENAVLHMARSKQIELASTSVTAAIDIGPRKDGSLALTASPSVILGGTDQAITEALVAAAHGVCPYSHAARGNIDIQLNTIMH